MSGQYFENNPLLKHEEQSFGLTKYGNNYRFLTDSGVFSRSYLDFGSETLIDSFIHNSKHQSLLDFGCGYGPIGIILKTSFPFIKVTFLDINERAVALTVENLKINHVDGETFVNDSLDNLSNKWDCITLNPPIRSGKINVFKMYQSAYDHLNSNGEFWVVIQKKQGAESSIKELVKIFDNCTTINKNKGYFVLMCKKN